MIHDFHLDEVHRFWAYQRVLPDSKEMRTLHKWINDHKEDECVMYHGTLGTLPIMNEGLKPTSARTRKSLQSASGFVYVSIYPNMARTFAEMAYPSKPVKVYAVRVKIMELKADKDQLRNQRVFGNVEIPKDTLACSLALGHGARIPRKLWPYELSEVYSSATNA